MTTTPIGDARRRAANLYPRSKSFQGAYVKGARARLAGRPIDSCPYAFDREKTWRGTFRAAWIHGWQSAASGFPDEARERGEL